jgi:hypothetical protein
MELRTKERLLFLATITSGIFLALFTVIGLLHVLVAIQGLKLTSSIHDQQELDMRFSRVAWVAKHACNGMVNQTINIHCPTISKFSKSSAEPFESAAALAFAGMVENSTLFRMTPWTVQQTTWVWQQQMLFWLYHKIVGPWVLLLIFACVTLVLSIIPYYSLQQLKGTTNTRRANMAKYNRTLDSVIQDHASHGDTPLHESTFIYSHTSTSMFDQPSNTEGWRGMQPTDSFTNQRKGFQLGNNNL